jgi:hypothetical protein
MEQHGPWQAYNRFVSQEIPLRLWISKFHYDVHKNQPLFPILDQMNQVRIITSFSFTSILILSSHQHIF